MLSSVDSLLQKARAVLPLTLIPFAGLTLVLLFRALPGYATGRDFRQLYAAGYMVRSGQGSQLYDIEAQRRVQERVVSGGPGGYINFIRPAYEALLVAPFSFLPYRTAYFCFLGLNLVLLGATIAMLSPASVLGTVQVASIVLSFMPVSIALFAGQDSVLLLAILAASAKALDRESSLLAGVIAGLGLFKFQVVIPIFLLFVVWKRWRFCCGVALAALGVGLLSIWITGIHQMGAYWRVLGEVDGNKTLGVPMMANFHGLLGTMGNISGKWVIAAHLVVGCLLAIFLPRLEGRNGLLLAIPAAVLCSYYLFSHDLTVLLLPMVAVLVAREGTALASNLAWWSALLLLLAPTALMAHLYLVALPLSLFLLGLAWGQGRAGEVVSIASEA